MRSIQIKHLILLVGLSSLALPARAQLVTDFQPPKTGCCLLGSFQRLTEQLADWNQLGRYHADDERLKAMPPEPGRVVFLGDSITDGWDLAKSFPGKPYVNRGISGQTTAQMLVRLYPDVIDLHPAVLIILAGTNDIAGNNGSQTITMVEENLQAITELATQHGIKVILCTLTPVSDYTSHPQTGHRPPADILKLNEWLRSYAAKEKLGFVDYFSATVDEKGMLREGFSEDGLHPNAKGYALMAPVAEEVIEQALR
ncbi:MAG TPA: SGNH/GDSL hydrolase family protein [Terriglobia bacterium]|nr:SGNH/GDSL hydrolase family protein [Terriglobia bacterium]